jgi:hypothetical protein|nr:MAG TPA: hypothetical protein [Caudoviricetes sp.]
MIEVNEYVRINMDNRNCIGIGRVSRIVNETIYVNMNNKYNLPVSFQIDKIVKHSKQLIDLIGCGDIVNRHLIIDKYEDVDEYGNDFWCLIIEDDSLLNRSIREENIQTILTKEQYLTNCYKVGGEDEF